MSYTLAQHAKGNYVILHAFNHLTGMDGVKIYELEKLARKENAPYDAIFRTKDGEWALLRTHVTQKAPLRKEIDRYIEFNKQKELDGIPF